MINITCYIHKTTTQYTLHFQIWLGREDSVPSSPSNQKSPQHTNYVKQKTKLYSAVFKGNTSTSSSGWKFSIFCNMRICSRTMGVWRTSWTTLRRIYVTWGWKYHRIGRKLCPAWPDCDISIMGTVRGLMTQKNTTACAYMRWCVCMWCRFQEEGTDEAQCCGGQLQDNWTTRYCVSNIIIIRCLVIVQCVIIFLWIQW